MTALNGQTITYDALGNPTNYLGHTLRWNRVRQLEYFDNTWFDYDIFGKRTRKSSIFYGYEGDRLIRELRDDVRLIYFHDATGFIGFKCTPRNSTTGEKLYYYKKNLQGDVVGIYDEDGIEVASYAYDAWGKCTILSETDGIGTLNPIRYRSYYYDIETGLYYLNSRYYDPNTGRFINADVQFDDGAGLLGYNLYAYCANNPVAFSDQSGKSLDVAINAVVDVINRLANFIRDFICIKDNTYLTEQQMQINATLIYLYLKRQDWSHNAICAVLGNMQSESTISPGRYQVNGGAFGLVQWDPASKYTVWAEENGFANNSLTGQLTFLITSMQPGQGEWFKNKKYANYYLPYNEFIHSDASVDYLSLVFLYSYERPRNPNVSVRKNNAMYWSSYFN